MAATRTGVILIQHGPERHQLLKAVPQQRPEADGLLRICHGPLVPKLQRWRWVGLLDLGRGALGGCRRRDVIGQLASTFT